MTEAAAAGTNLCLGDGSNDPTVECAICFECVAASTALPCTCKISYCGSCWDKALAQSFNACGQARCPTCRGPVRVDYDAEVGALKFSKETAELEPTSQQDAVERLAEQALPRQIRILKEYGEAHPSLPQAETLLPTISVGELKRQILVAGGITEDCVEKADLIRRLKEVCIAEIGEGIISCIPSFVASVSLPAPTCVCGSALMRVSGKLRAVTCCENYRPDLPHSHPVFEALLNHVTCDMTSAGVLCDLCDGHVGLNAAVWTCQNGQSTILHATSYDICDECFVRHVTGTSNARGEEGEEMGQ
eukprot:TRINITY_DN43676_c0_g1_i1.p1 TRINITY_DN43676_c0_g1~~TRINITY_DN43676_c0_g1_i1.p1  ORF type:complete len:312 (+),score=35.02 TRINITY_DN43676_c0_g1_i1:25-936(+)